MEMDAGGYAPAPPAPYGGYTTVPGGYSRPPLLSEIERKLNYDPAPPVRSSYDVFLSPSLFFSNYR